MNEAHWSRLTRWLLLSFVIHVFTSACLAAEFRGLWVDGFGPGFLDAAQVRKLVSDCRKYNFNAVLVEMRRRGDAFYDSRYDPRTTAIATNFDALAEIIKECHTGTPRIEVHCWIVSHFIWAWKNAPEQSEHVFNRHPEYLTQDSIGQRFVAKGWFLDPGNPEANQTVYNAAKDIVSRYDIDGLHWDYCRYPTQDSGYNDTAIRRFNAEFGLNGQPAPDDPRFSEWRRRQVTDFLRWVNADLWEIKPNLVISAAVFASVRDALDYRFADWPTWTREGIVDACMPMNFASDNRRLFCPRADEALKSLGCRQIYMGQGAYMNPKENTLTQMDYIRGKGFSGAVFYSYRSPNQGDSRSEEVFEQLKERFQPTWTETPALPWKQDRAILKGGVRRKGTEMAVYNALVTLRPEPGREQRTEPHGRYAFFNLSPGRYTVEARTAPDDAVTASMDLKAGQVLNLDLLLPR